ncbi:MAG: M56 family metallopeptidase [Bacteroidota bacterium]
MDFIYQIIPQEIITAIGWTIFHSIWQGVIISLVLGVTLLLSGKRSSAFRYNLSVGALTLLLFASIATFSKVYQPGGNLAAPSINNFTQPLTNFAVSTINNLESSPSTQSLIEKIENLFSDNLPLIVTAWFFGLVIFSLRFIGGLIYIERLRTKNIHPLSPKWIESVDRFTKRLKIKSHVKIFESVKVKVPVAIGYLKPVILLPIGMISGLPQNQVESIIIHELAHIKRYDFLVNLLQTLAETILFYHPAAWWISSVIRSEREDCCDDITLDICDDSLTYSKALYNIQQLKTNGALFALAAVGNENQLFRRIKRMNGNKNKLSYGIKFAAFSLVIAAIAVVAIYSPSSYASKNKNVTKVGLANPFTYLNEGFTNLDNNSPSLADTTSFKKGKRTLKFYEGEGENRKKYKAKINDGKLEELYVDGDKIPKNELNKYEDKVQNRVDEYDSLLKEYRDKRKEYKELLKDYSEKLKDYKDKLRDYRAESHSWDNDFDFDFDFDIPAPDMSELHEAMRELHEELGDEFADRSFHVPPVPPIHIPPIHIPPINIPPIPPILFNDEEWDEWQDEFKANMEEFRENMKEHKWDMDGFKDNMKNFGEEMRKFGDFMREAKDELVKDGIVKDGDDIDQFYLSEKKMEVNGEKLSHELHKKYLEMHEKITGKKLEGKHKIIIND